MPFFSPMRNESAKDLEMKTPFNNNLPTQIGDVIINPQNPVNPDSKAGVKGKFKLKTFGEKTRGIASLLKKGIKSATV